MRSQVAKKVKNAKAPRVFLKATDREPARRNLLGEIYRNLFTWEFARICLYPETARRAAWWQLT